MQLWRAGTAHGIVIADFVWFEYRSSQRSRNHHSRSSRSFRARPRKMIIWFSILLIAEAWDPIIRSTQLFALGLNYEKSRRSTASRQNVVYFLIIEETSHFTITRVGLYRIHLIPVSMRSYSSAFPGYGYIYNPTAWTVLSIFIVFAQSAYRGVIVLLAMYAIRF